MGPVLAIRFWHFRPSAAGFNTCSGLIAIMRLNRKLDNKHAPSADNKKLSHKLVPVSPGCPRFFFRTVIAGVRLHRAIHREDKPRHDSKFTQCIQMTTSEYSTFFARLLHGINDRNRRFFCTVLNNPGFLRAFAGPERILPFATGLDRYFLPGLAVSVFVFAHRFFVYWLFTSAKNSATV